MHTVAKDPDKYWKAAQEWFKNNAWMQTWNTGCHSAVAAVAEYMANQNGETLFKKEILE